MLSWACSDVVAPTPPAQLEIAPTSLVLDVVGDTARLSATIRDAFGNALERPDVAWTSSQPGVATVDSGGLVAGMGQGTAWVRASAGEVRDSLWVQVEPPLLLEARSPDSVSAPVATEVTLQAQVTDAQGTPRGGVPVRWVVEGGVLDSPSETRSDGDGGVEATWTLDTTTGTQRATAWVERTGDPITLSFTVRAEPGPPVTAALEADSVQMSGTGEAALLEPTLLDAFGNITAQGSEVVTWSTSGGAVAEVDGDGRVTAVGEGAAVVRAHVAGVAADSIRVEVALRGAITLTFDDGWRSVYDNAWPEMKALPWLRANVGVYTEAVGWPGFLSQDHLDELHGAGWSMVSHTVSHDSLSTLDPEALEAELRDSQAWIQARGYRGANVLIAPYHDFPEAARATAATFYRAARGISAHATAPETLREWMPDGPHELTGIPADDLPYTTEDGRDRLRALLQRVVDEGAFLDLFLHQVPEENVPAFRQLLAVLEEFKDRVRPYHELFPEEPRTIR